MIECDPDSNSMTMSITGITPNGNAVVTRTQPGKSPLLLRGGVTPVTAGGISLVDTEAPIGIPVEYVVTISDITAAGRLVQQNLMLTPDFTHGSQSWAAGPNRTLTTPADSTAHTTTAVGNVTLTATTTTPTTPPTLIGHKDSAVTVSGSYVLDPATPTGGAAIATNDWMIIVHTQLSASANPADPSGWTRIDDQTANDHRQIIWKRKRVGGDTSYTVAAASGAQSVGSLLWVRGSGDTLTVGTTATVEEAGVSTSIATHPHAAIRPALVLSLFSASATVGQGAALTATARIQAEGGLSNVGKVAARGALAAISASGRGSGPVSGATWSYTMNSTASPRTLIVATSSRTEAADTPAVTAAYGSPMTMGFATQIAFQVADVLTNRVVVAAKAGAIPATTADAPHLLTGRFKFTHPGLWNWADVLAQGTWQNLKDTKPTWLDVRGSSSTTTGHFLHLFVTIVDPTSGADYIPPQLISVGLDTAANSWIDVAMLFANTSSIPSTAEIRFVHGSALKEFGATWRFDEWGLTPGAQRARNYDSLYWFSGDTSLPANTSDYLLGPGWEAMAGDAAITWAGTAGNSISEFRTASSLTASTICQLDTPAIVPCEPVYLSDPVNVNLALWVGLIDVDDLTRSANRGVYQILNSGAPVAVSSTRQWETSTLTVATSTLAERDQMNLMLNSGRVLLLRNPDPSYPETDWYLSIGDTQESRMLSDARHPERLWRLPVARVERPTGLIEMSGGVTWADVLAMGTWDAVRTTHDNWLDVLDGED